MKQYDKYLKKMKSIKNKKLINQNIFQISQKGEQGIHELNIYFSYNPILCYLFNTLGIQFSYTNTV